jgi:hypothetical protein
MTTIDVTAKAINEAAERYHLRTEVSKSMLAEFHQRRRVYEARFVKRTMAPKEPTRAMKIGTLVHAAILEPDKIDDMYVVIPDSLLSGANRSISSTEAKNFVKSVKANGRHAIKADELPMIRGMAESVHRECGDWIRGAKHRETTITWQHPATGIPCRCRYDFLRFTKNQTIIVPDIKTTNDISEHAFRSTIESFDYWLQDSHYSEGIEAVHGRLVEQFIFIAVESDEPYQCRTFALDDVQREAAKEARERLMGNLAECMTTGNYAEPWEGRITKVSIRPFAFNTGDI